MIRENTITVVRRGSIKPTTEDALKSDIKVNRITINKESGSLPNKQSDNLAVNPYAEID